MKLFTMLDDPRIEPATKARYKAVVAKLEGEYLFEEERRPLIRELAELNKKAARQVGGRR